MVSIDVMMIGNISDLDSSSSSPLGIVSSPQHKVKFLFMFSKFTILTHIFYNNVSVTPGSTCTRMSTG